MMQFKTEKASKEDEQKLEHRIILADGSLFPYQGKLYAIDRQVDTKTGTIRMAAVFPNPGNLLRPGQFVRVRVTTGIKNNALLVPQQAVTELQGSFEIAVVERDSSIDIRIIKPGQCVGAQWIIDSGLTEGDRVVVEGVQKVKQGARVWPRPYSDATDSQGAASR